MWRIPSNLPLHEEGLQGEELFVRNCRDRTMSNGYKERKSRLDIRKKFLAVRVVKHWTRLLREVVDAPALVTFRARWDKALSNLA